MERIIAVNTNTYHGFGIEETLYEIKKSGFKLKANIMGQRYKFYPPHYVKIMLIFTVLSVKVLIPES